MNSLFAVGFYQIFNLPNGIVRSIDDLKACPEAMKVFILAAPQAVGTQFNAITTVQFNR